MDRGVKMGPCNVITGPWNLNRVPCNVIMGPWNVNRGPWEWLLDHVM